MLRGTMMVEGAYDEVRGLKQKLQSASYGDAGEGSPIELAIGDVVIKAMVKSYGSTHSAPWSTTPDGVVPSSMGVEFSFEQVE